MKKITKMMITMVLAVTLTISANTYIFADSNNNKQTTPSSSQISKKDKSDERKIHIVYKNEREEIIGEDFAEKKTSRYLVYTPIEIEGYEPFIPVEYIDTHSLVDNTYVIYYGIVQHKLEVVAKTSDGEELTTFEFWGNYNESQEINLQKFGKYVPSIPSINYSFLKDEVIEVIYEVEKFTITVIIKDRVNDEIIATTSITEDRGELVNIPLPKVDGYDNGDGNLTQIIIKDDTVMLSYNRSTTELVINYLLDDKVIASDSVAQEYLSNYSFQPKSFSGYEYSVDDYDFNGIMPAKNKTINVQLKPQTMKANVLLKDDLGNTVQTVQLEGKYRNGIPFDVPEIEGYHRNMETGQILIDGDNLDYVIENAYTRKNIALTIRYITDDGSIVKKEEYKNFYKESYNIKLSKLRGFEIVGEVNEISGIMLANDFTIDVKVQELKYNNNIIVKDDLGNNLYETTIYGTLDSKLAIELPEVSGYAKVKDILEVDISETDKPLIYNNLYIRNSYSLIVNYMTADGTLINSITTDYFFKEAYKFDLLVIPGYQLVTMIEDIPFSGVMGSSNEEVNIIIEPVVIKEDHTSTNNENVDIIVEPVAIKDDHTSINNEDAVNKLPQTGVSAVNSTAYSFVLVGFVSILISKRKKLFPKK